MVDRRIFLRSAAGLLAIHGSNIPTTMALESGKRTAEQLGVQGLGWVIRRIATETTPLAKFYEQAWGVYQPRQGVSPSGARMLWAGDITMLGIAVLDPTVTAESRHDELSVVMATGDFSAALQRVREAGAVLQSQVERPIRSATLSDPSGRMLGLRETVPPGRMLTLGGASLPPEFGGISQVIVRAADPVRLAAFYENTLCLPSLPTETPGAVALALGRGVELVLMPGGRRLERPEDRRQVPDVWILRVYDHDGLAARLRSLGVPVVDTNSIGGGVLSYFLDPEGHLFGIQQRTADLLTGDSRARIEDEPAWAAWDARSKD
jgi:predicted enzyme related to lactoylglutathione lyase